MRILPSMKEPVFIIDGSGYIFRAYYGIRPLTSSKGVPTNAVYGFSSMLQKLIKDHKPKYLAIAFDTGSKNFRHNLYPEYKSNRPPPPADLVPQFDLIRRLVDAFEIAQFSKK
ncbi:MAG: PIN domain-containing protein, partial [Myxococcaceae bacterium]